MISEIDKLKHFHAENYSGTDCRAVILKQVKHEKK